MPNYAFVQGSIEALSADVNAIISVRDDTTEVTAGVTEVLCYGTAVLVEPQ